MLNLLNAGNLYMQVLLTVWFCHRNYKKSTKNLKCVRTSSLKIPCFWTYVEFSSLTTISLSGVDPIHWISIIILHVLVPSMQQLQLSWNRCLFWCMYTGCIDLRCCFVFHFTLLNILLYSYPSTGSKRNWKTAEWHGCPFCSVWCWSVLLLALTVGCMLCQRRMSMHSWMLVLELLLLQKLLDKWFQK